MNVKVHLVGPFLCADDGKFSGLRKWDGSLLEHGLAVAKACAGDIPENQQNTGEEWFAVFDVETGCRIGDATPSERLAVDKAMEKITTSAEGQNQSIDEFLGVARARYWQTAVGRALRLALSIEFQECQ